jgi:hypothetical protein
VSERVTMTLPGETEAGSAGMHPCRGIAWWAHRNDVAGRESSSFALSPKTHRIGRPLCLENPRPEGAEYSLVESATSPLHAEPEQSGFCWSTWLWALPSVLGGLSVLRIGSKLFVRKRIWHAAWTELRSGAGWRLLGKGEYDRYDNDIYRDESRVEQFIQGGLGIRLVCSRQPERPKRSTPYHQPDVHLV